MEIKEWWYKWLCKLPMEEKAMMYDAICRYALYGERVELVYYLDCMMDILCREIDESKELEKKRKEGEERPTATAKKNDETTEEGTTQRKQNTQSRIVRVQEQARVVQEQARVEQEQARVQEQEQVREAQVQEQVREAQMAWQTSRKNVNERSMQPQHAMQQSVQSSSVQSSSVQSSSVRVHAVKPPSFRDVGIDEAVNALRRDEAWCELVKKRFGVSNCKMAERLEEFILHCKAKGKERHGSQEDLKAHFCSWLRIRKDIEKRQTENGKCKEGGLSFTRRRGFEPTTPEVTEYTERL